MTPSSPSSSSNSSSTGPEQLSKTNLYIRGLPPATTDLDLVKLCHQWVRKHRDHVTMDVWDLLVAEKEGPKVSFSCIFRVCVQYAKQHSFTGIQTLVWVGCLAAIILMFIFSLGFLRWHPSLCIPSSFPPQNSKALQPYGASPSWSQLFSLVPGFSRSDQLTEVL